MVWPPPPDVALPGRVVELSPVQPTRHAAKLFAALDSEPVWRHLTSRPADPVHYRQLLQDAIATGRLPWLVTLAREYAGLPAGSVVGTSSYLEISVPDARLEIGFTAYRHEVWATAVNPDTKHLLFGYAFEVLGAGRVQLKTDVRNVRSQAAIARLGAHYEGTLRRYQRRADDTVRDSVLFSVLAEEWPSVRAGLRRRLDAAGV